MRGAARRSAGTGLGHAGGHWAEDGVTWRGELVASGSAAPWHLPFQAPRAFSLARANTSSPAKGRGRRTGAGRGAQGRIRVVSPRGNLRCHRAGGNDGGQRESVTFAHPEPAEAGPWRAASREGRPQQRDESRATLSAFHARVPAPETARHPWPGLRWPVASLAPTSGGARLVPVTHFGASAAR